MNTKQTNSRTTKNNNKEASKQSNEQRNKSTKIQINTSKTIKQTNKQTNNKEVQKWKELVSQESKHYYQTYPPLALSQLKPFTKFVKAVNEVRGNQWF